ncbi:L-ascorbate peroxidase-like [Dorcoceras hygrometricum]|uniref:L-ascorbate peroxidase-like n=1 Tax=Dorcoceras hygrometricum TaxID=472368 RepID=A0A2Z7BSP1_9LAMI|nr:L-ascorbate peroxidase-like [Dorcoceras hygrometricum]
MRSTAATMDLSLLRTAPSTATVPSPVFNVGGKKLALTGIAVSPPSDGRVCCTFGKRELMFIATTSFFLPGAKFSAAQDVNLRLQEEINRVLSKGNAAGLLRLVFHDAGTFDKIENTGGMNGSIIYELDRLENTGLKRSLKILEKVKAEVDSVRPVSWADLIAAAGAYAVSICGGPNINVDLGRVDAMVPDPEGRLPEETQGVASVKQSFKRKGFSTQELVALSGAHTLGNKGFGNPTVFDNSYYKVLLEKPWSSSDGMSGMIGLPSDRALVQDDECLRWISKYAVDQDLFFEDFKNAYIKLVNSGAKWNWST